ncbi:phage portal protein family protein [Tissierella praeacuta]|uniref:phage portal protein family protein n=1 Tax=Tissierella praeacuta TaxID=43131 RepID=UPI003DA6A5D2
MGLFNFFKKKEDRREDTGGTCTVQTRDSFSHPFSELDKYIPLKAEYNLYKTMREAVPILDTAINRIVRLVGAFDIECESDKQEEQIKEFINNIKVNSNQIGMHSFVESYLDQLIECGNTAGEIILNNAKNDIYALKNIDIRTIKLKQTDNPLMHLVCQVQPGKHEAVELPYQDLILFTPLDPEGDSPYGISLFRSMPFMVSILLKIFTATDLNWERFGNPRYSVVYKPTDDKMDKKKVEERVKMIEDTFNKVMQKIKGGKVSDFTGVGNIEIKVIGADNQILNSEVPVKQILEQLVAKTGLPPFLLGLSWSTTERMSQQQADFLTSELDNYRDEVTPTIKYIIDTWQTVTGKNIPYEIVWDEINLQDAVEMARADLFKQQARSKEIENTIRLRNENIIDQDMAANELGYEEPAGEAPPRFSLLPSENNQEDDGEENNKSVGNNKSKHKDCNCSTKSPFNAPPEDPIQLQIEQDTLKGYMKCVNRLEKKILDLIPVLEESSKDKSKSYIKTKDLPPIIEDKIKEAIKDFVIEMIGRGSGDETIEYYGTYGQYLLHAFGYGTIRGNQIIREEFPDNASERNEVIANYNHPYVQELLRNGMELVKTKAKDKEAQVINIMAEHAAVGDNPVEWARDLDYRLKRSITGERWYWERLARSESAMAIDRAEMAEYEAEGFFYCEWDAAPDACYICLGLNGDMWPLEDAPKVVKDTHPHCRCRKKPRTKRQYDEYMGNI